jgi:hypothetical protein
MRSVLGVCAKPAWLNRVYSEHKLKTNLGWLVAAGGPRPGSQASCYMTVSPW